MAQVVWVLIITHDDDDYKRREGPTSEVYLTFTRKDANDRLIDVMHRKMKDFYDTDTSVIDEQILPYLDTNNDFKIKEEYHQDEEALSLIHSIIATGDYVPFRWTYEIVQKTIE